MNSPDQMLEKTPRPGPASASLEEAAAASSTKLRHAAIVAGILIVTGTLAGLLPRWHHRSTLAAETKELAVQTVTVVSPAPSQAAPNLVLPAEVKPYFEAPIYARANGYLKHWLVDIGSLVKEGDLLAEIDTPELDQQLVQARAELAQTDAALALAKTTAARWAELLKTASVSEQEAEEKRADLELKQANVEAARANVGRLEEMQRFQKVRAPFSGTITVRNTDVGQLITSGGSHELFRLAQIGTLRVYARVPQLAARSVTAGQTAELTIPEIPGKTFPAKVVRTSGAMSADSRTLLVELEVDNSRGEILSGTYAQVRFPEANPGAALTIPGNALLFRAEGPQAGVVDPNGKVTLRNLTLGRDFGSLLEILNGLSATDHVILNPADSLVSGITVRVAKAEGEAVKGR